MKNKGNTVKAKAGSQRELFENNPELLKEVAKQAREKGKKNVEGFKERQGRESAPKQQRQMFEENPALLKEMENKRAQRRTRRSK